MCFSLGMNSVRLHIVLKFIFLFSALIILRLYDDLMQFKNDKGKLKRNYTDPIARNTLFKTLIIAIGIFLSALSYFDLNFAFYILLFFLFNHLLYKSYINNKIAAAFLPLLKYPVLCIAVQSPHFQNWNSELVISSTVLFLSMVTFESLEDPTFPIKSNYSTHLQVIIYVLLYSLNLHDFIYFSIFLTVSLIYTHLKLKYFPYVFLFLLIIFKIITSNYGI